MNPFQTKVLSLGVFSIVGTQLGMIGLLPMLAREYGIDVATAGLAISLFSLAVAVSGPILPLLASRFSRKNLMLTVLGVFTAGMLSAAFAPSFPLLLVAIVLPAFFHPVYISLALALAAESVEQAFAPKAVAKVMVGVSLSAVVAVPLAGFLAGTISVRAGFLFFALMNAVPFFLTLLFPSMPVIHRMAYGRQLGILKRPKVWFSIVAVVMLNGAIFGVYGFLGEFLGRVAGAGTNVTSLVLLLYGIANIGGNLIAGHKLVKSPGRLLRGFVLLLALVYLSMFAVGGAFTVMAPLIVGWGLLGGICGVVNQYLIASAAPDAPVFANGLFLFATNLGTAMATAFCGLFISAFGIRSVGFGGLVFLAVGAGLLLPATANRAGKSQKISDAMNTELD